MTRNEVISKLIIIGFTKEDKENVIFKYKNIIDIKIGLYSNMVFYSKTSAHIHTHKTPIDTNAISKILEFIEENSNDS